MSTTTSVLESVQVAKPCPAKWEDMVGDDRVRHCGGCRMDVFDLSAMQRAEAEAFVAARQGVGRTCVRFYRRTDGRMLTEDCPVGVRAAWKRIRWAAAGLLAGGFAVAAMIAPRGSGAAPQIAPLKQIHEFVQAHFGVAPSMRVLAGEMSVPSPPCPAPNAAPPVEMGDMVVPTPK